MWDVHIVAKQRHEDLLRRSAHRRRVAQAKAAAATRLLAGQAGWIGRVSPAGTATPAAHQHADGAGRVEAAAPARVRARRALGFALVQAGLWVLVGPRGRRPFEQLAWHTERETARASESHRS